MRSLRTNRFCASGPYYYGAREVGATSVVDGAAKAGALRLEVGGPADGGGKAEGGELDFRLPQTPVTDKVR